MPTITTLSSYILHNLGPLTTTFTAPASCATTPPAASLALPELPMYAYWAESCTYVGHRLADCFPSGAAWEERYYYSVRSTDDPRPPDEIPFFSPAAACPSAWTTAGVAARARGEDGASLLSPEGIFAPSAWVPAETSAAPSSTSTNSNSNSSSGSSSSSGDSSNNVATDSSEDYTPGINPIPNILMEALAPGETAVVCCPSAWTALLAGNVCYSNLPRSAYTATTGCQRRGGAGSGPTFVEATFTWNGTAVTGSAISYTATGTETGPLWTALMTTFGVDDDDDDSSGFRGGGEEEDLYTGVVTTPMVTLVHKAGDMTEGAGEGEGDGGGSGGAALRVAGAGGDVGMLIAVWVVAALVGAVVVFPS
ncbi:hypothetical protein MGN70_000534 [Eutypa lata]|nr:hypothetical protein MGN70_000534 [Eutypa lata]